MIPPKAEEFMAKRMGATVRIFGKCKKYTFRTESLSNVGNRAKIYCSVLYARLTGQLA